MRIDAQNWRTLQGQELDEQVQLAKDVAKYLRQNIAQIRKTNEADDTWREYLLHILCPLSLLRTMT
jgi:hypothetical protein